MALIAYIYNVPKLSYLVCLKPSSENMIFLNTYPVYELKQTDSLAHTI